MPIPDLLPVPYPPDADYTRQAVEVPGTKRPGQTGALRDHWGNAGSLLILLHQVITAIVRVIEIVLLQLSEVVVSGLPLSDS